MNRNVLVSVRGMFLAPAESEKDELELLVPGEYFERGGSRYILYEEQSTDFEEPIKNLVKITGKKVELRKRGLITANLVFDENTENMSHYTTPFGSIVMGIAATKIEISDSPDKLEIKMAYKLELNYEHGSDCNIEIKVSNLGETTEK